MYYKKLFGPVTDLDGVTDKVKKLDWDLSKISNYTVENFIKNRKSRSKTKVQLGKLDDVADSFMMIYGWLKKTNRL